MKDIVRRIDPGFMRDIEIALYTMLDYARSEPASSPQMQIVKNGDLERANVVLNKISKWFDDQYEKTTL